MSSVIITGVPHGSRTTVLKSAMTAIELIGFAGFSGRFETRLGRVKRLLKQGLSARKTDLS